MTTVDKQLTSPVPVHTNHDVEQASSTVYQRKEELKRKDVDTDLPTKRLVADAVSGISFEGPWEDELPHLLPCKDGSPHQTSC